MKKTQKAHPRGVITPGELRETIDVMLFDLRSIAAVTSTPRRTVENYAYGVRAIPEEFALKLRLAMIREFYIKRECEAESKRFWAEFDRRHPNGIFSEVEDF